MLDNWHQRKICQSLEQVLLGRVNRLLINVPPRSGKTETAVKSFIGWGMGMFPDSEFIHASYSKRLATSNTYEVRAMMQNETYKEIFPWTALQDDSKARDEFRTAHGGIVYATGADGTITGYGAGKMRPGFGGAIIIDDPHKAGDANSSVMRKNVIDWYQQTMESRLNKRSDPIIIIMQRLHEDDLSGWLLGGGSGEKWSHINIPARTDEGTSFWPAQFPDEMLDRLESSSPYVFAGQYMQRPSPLGGGLFRDNWWRYLSAPPPIQWRTIYADTAQKTADHNDYSVFQCWGYSVTGQAVMLDMIRGKWEAPELEAMARAFWAKHKATQNQGTLRAMKVEDKVSGTGLIQTLKREGIPIIGIKRNVDKITRAFDAAPLIESGNVILMQDTPHLTDFISEASTFPNAAHDDMIDAAMSAISDILQQTIAPAIRTL
ncbi:MAG TPA: phage terminase large subunit [Hyphomicrobiaceae bacterium]|nr:phage terminase large subunit [Hyphomicrobiaceae bacterium]